MTLASIKGVGVRKLAYLAKLNIIKISDLLTHFPRTYEDRRECRFLKDYLIDDNKKHPVEVEVLGYDYIFARNKKILKIIISDGFMRASLICFNRDFLKDILKENDKYIIFGDFQYKYGELQASSFEFVPKGLASDSLNFLRIVPIYSLTDGITQKFLREIIHDTLNLTKFEESLPLPIIKKRGLISKGEAFKQIHFPDDFNSLKKAVNRLKYFELFELEVNVALKKYFFANQKKKRYRYSLSEGSSKIIEPFIRSLPFTLTEGQTMAYNDIEKDLLSDYPMHRLIQGDVGSGKTLVAELSILMAVENGYQSVLMVPTEILARQHCQTLTKHFSKYDIEVTLLIGGLRASVRRHTLNSISTGLSKVIVGTHALFSDDVEFANLGLVVIDEQHKFGVWERARLIDKGQGVDILVMTATPIPRTLALTVYGDMDLSVIRDKPKRGSNIKSKCVFNTERRGDIYEFINKEIDKGRQGFVVCPMIDDSDKLDVSSVSSVYDEIRLELLPNRRTTFIHGRLSSFEKEELMNQFVNGFFDILISTSVIEVGVDISNASFMVVENADYFGLSQLHQLRGRIGRGEYDSFCFFIVPNSITEEAKERIKAIVSHNDGFALAEEDLKIRGPGEFLGIRQSGVDSLKIANLITDEDILIQAKRDAFDLVSSDPSFKDKANSFLEKTLYKKFIEKYRLLLTG